MQTFLPYPDFLATAHVLDRKRLGKQRVEVLQILRALELPDYGWQNHPAVRMWQGYTPALVRYGLDCVRAWTARGHGDSTAGQIAEFAPWVIELSQADLERESLLPGWLGDERLHRSHRSQLIAKDPEFYRPLFPESPEGLDYFWPEPAPPVDTAEPGPPGFLWVLRPETEQALGRSVLTGVAGFGPATGVPVDASVGELAALRALQGNPGRRPSRAVRALADFVLAVRPGDEIGVLVSDGRSLLVGRVTGPYAFTPRDTAGLLHRRSVTWERIVTRSSLPRPAALQDVRPLFSVTWNAK
ncbi:MSMEG_6728 family protein [Jatrophihabitans sp.]|uniref:MSMEG_6728 family protein n=1 Tax=Jatrophihabitans sp. TaxID=1932789 RepID=UPI002CAFF970|nr:MSMEG_6728 family protein [Jatrophihabitans sp.]